MSASVLAVSRCAIASSRSGSLRSPGIENAAQMERSGWVNLQRLTHFFDGSLPIIFRFGLRDNGDDFCVAVCGFGRQIRVIFLNISQNSPLRRRFNLPCVVDRAVNGIH